MAVVRTTTNRGRDYQRVDVAILLDLHAPRYRSPRLSTLWQKIVQCHKVVKVPGLARYEIRDLDLYELLQVIQIGQYD